MLKRIGKWKIITLETGTFSLDGGAMMGSVPKILWEKTNPSDRLNRIELALRCLLLDDGERKVLIETGLGNKFDKKFSEMFDIRQSNYPLKDALKKNGYSIDDITHLILTHLHFDHAGGATCYSEKGDIVPTFPNATYFVSRDNWEAGLNPSPRDSASYLSIDYLPIQESGNLKLISNNMTIIDGISTLVVNGHTYGQQLVKVESEDDTLVFCADLIPLRSHLRLPWIMGYDLNAVLTLKEKTEFLKNAADNNWWLWFYHDPKTVAVQIRKGKKYYEIEKEVLK